MAEWGNPAVRDGSHTLRSEQTEGTETSKYLEEREINRDALSSGERKGPEPKPLLLVSSGVVGPADGTPKC